MERRRHSVHDRDRGAILILALIYVVAVSLVVIALASWAANNLKNTARFTSATQMEASARNTAEVAINSIRYTPLLASNQTLNASPANYCWGTSAPSSETYTFKSGNSTNTQTYAFSAWCSTTWNPLSAVSRVVNIYVCPSTVGVTSCEASPFLAVVVQFDDYPPGSTSSPIPSICSVWCGQGMTILTWDWHPSNGAQSANVINLTSSAPTNAVVGGLYAPVVSSNSGNVVQVASSTPLTCTVTSNVVQFISVGDCSLTFSDPGTIAYAPAASVTQSFSVASATPSALSITTVLGTYGTPLTLAATCTTSCATTKPLQFALTNVPSNSSCTLSGAVLTSSGAGGCTVYAFKLGDGVNPAVQSADTTVAFAPAVLTVTPNTASSPFGGTPVTITPRYAGFVGSDSASSLSTPPACSTTTPINSQSIASTYQSVCSGGVSANYTFNYVSGSYTITAQALYVVPNSLNVTFGSTPTYTQTYHTGSVTGPSVSPTFAVSAPVCTSAYTPTTSVGTVDQITCSGGVDSNYTFVETSTASLTVIATTPGAPTAVNATAGQNASSLVSWTAPSSNGGAAISRYTVTSSPGTLTCTSATTSCTVNALTNGTNYTFTVTATNSAGTSASSVASAPVVPVGPPSAPTGVTATAGKNTYSVVSWSVPTSNGGSPISQYTVTSAPGAITASCANSPCTVTGLTNGTSYTFTVTASNGTGTGPASAASPAIVPIGPPGAPTAVTAVGAQNGVSLVSWVPPSSNGGAAISSYTVTSSPGGYTCSTASTSCTVSGLTNGSGYSFTVSATNSAGVGNPSTSSATIVPSTVPSAPTSVTAVAGLGSATISWGAPSSNGGAAISSYTVTSSPGAISATCAGSPCTVGGLTGGTSYSFTVKATNASGSTSSTASNSVTPYGVPVVSSFIVTPSTSSSYTLSWSTATNGSSLSGYDVEYLAYPSGAFAVPTNGTCASVTASSTSCTITGLASTSIYRFEIAAKSNAGSSAYAYDYAGYPTTIGAAVSGTANVRGTSYSYAVGNVTSGNDLILEFGSTSTNAGTPTVTATGTGASCNVSLTSAAAATNNARGATSDTEIWYAPNFASSCSGETVTVTFANAPSNYYGIVQQWTGLSWATPTVTDGVAQATNQATGGLSTTLSTGNVAPKQSTAFDVVIGLATSSKPYSSRSTPTVAVSGSPALSATAQSVDANGYGVGAYVVDPATSAAGLNFSSFSFFNDNYSAVAVAFLAN